MRLPTGPFVLTALSLLSIPSEIGAQTDRPIEGRWSCFTEYGQNTIYTTPVWDATAFLVEVTNDFSRFLLAEHGYKGGSRVAERCSPHPRRPSSPTTTRGPARYGGVRERR